MVKNMFVLLVERAVKKGCMSKACETLDAKLPDNEIPGM
jgi:hypothetical protein